jgi:hypothetical protein
MGDFKNDGIKWETSEMTVSKRRHQMGDFKNDGIEWETTKTTASNGILQS